MARKNSADTAKEKAAKQKKMAIVLGVVLALAMAYAVHTMMGMSGGSSSSRPQAADPSATTAAAVTSAPAATPTPSALPAAPSLGSAAPTTTTPSSSSAAPQLVSAVKPPADTGQLESFSRFESKDPFHAGGPGSGAADSPSSPSAGSSGSGKAPKTPPAPPAPPPTSAVISVNGSSESVTSGANFPAANPVFQLLSLTATTAKISVVGGSYASGAATLTLKVNTSVTLVNTADGTRYTLLLLPQGSVATAVTPATPGSTPTTSGG